MFQVNLSRELQFEIESLLLRDAGPLKDFLLKYAGVLRNVSSAYSTLRELEEKHLDSKASFTCLIALKVLIR